MDGGFAATLQEGGKGCDNKGCGSSGRGFRCHPPSRWRCGAVPGLSTGSAVGVLVADACAGLSVSCAVVSFGEVEGPGVVCRKKHMIEPLSIGAGSSSRRRRRRVLPTTMGHAFARPLHSSTSMLLVSIYCGTLAHL